MTEEKNGQARDGPRGGSPRVELLDETKHRTRFRLENCNLGLVNAIRRTILTDLPTLAIDRVVIEQNTTTTSDQTLADILEKIPIVSESVDGFLVPRSECRCTDGCPECERAFRLVYKHADQKTIAHISDLDLQPIPHPLLQQTKSTSECSWSAEELKAIEKRHSLTLPISHNRFAQKQTTTGLPLFAMSYLQEVRLTAYVRRGNTRQHARWKPADVCYRPIWSVGPPNNQRLSELGMTMDEKRRIIQEDNENVWGLNEATGDFFVRDATRYSGSLNLWEAVNRFLVDCKNTKPTENATVLFPAVQTPGAYLFVIESYGLFASAKQVLVRALRHLCIRAEEMARLNASVSVTTDE